MLSFILQHLQNLVAGIRRASPGRHILGSPDLHAPLHAASGLCMLTICSHEVAAGAASTGSGSLVTDHSALTLPARKQERLTLSALQEHREALR